MREGQPSPEIKFVPKSTADEINDADKKIVEIDSQTEANEGNATVLRNLRIDREDVLAERENLVEIKRIEDKMDDIDQELSEMPSKERAEQLEAERLSLAQQRDELRKGMEPIGEEQPDELLAA